MTSLQERLDGIRAAFEKKAPDDAKAIMHRATEALATSGRAERAVGAGDAIPAFELADARGATVRSEDLLERGPMILSFFRGFW